MIAGQITKKRIESWCYTSPKDYGFYEVIAPGTSDCQQVFVYRLNLKKNDTYTLCTQNKEMNAACIMGEAEIKCEAFEAACQKLDSFYVTRLMEVEIKAIEDSVFYIGAAIDEGYGTPFFRAFDLSLPLGEIHQIHGVGVGEREVFMTINPEADASRLICGITWGGNGAWTSWPPHQHEKDLEEVYCYFNIEEPHFGLHLSYIEPGNVETIVAHAVTSGTMVLAPRGYHPTVAAPGARNYYFWVLAAHSHQSRRYDLAVEDSTMKNFN